MSIKVKVDKKRIWQFILILFGALNFAKVIFWFTGHMFIIPKDYQGSLEGNLPAQLLMAGAFLVMAIAHHFHKKANQIDFLKSKADTFGVHHAIPQMPMLKVVYDYQTLNIFSWGLGEATAIFGIITAFVHGPVWMMDLLIALSLTLGVIHRPQRSVFEKIFAEASFEEA